MDRQGKSFWWAIASAGAMVLGGFGPWAKVFGVISVSGTDGGDGWFVVIAAIFAAALIFFRQRRQWGVWPLVLAFIAAGVAGAAATYDWANLNRVANQTGLITAGWGVYLSTFGSISLAAACVGLWIEGRSSKGAVPATTEPVADGPLHDPQPTTEAVANHVSEEAPQAPTESVPADPPSGPQP